MQPTHVPANERFLFRARPTLDLALTCVSFGESGVFLGPCQLNGWIGPGGSRCLALSMKDASRVQVARGSHIQKPGAQSEDIGPSRHGVLLEMRSEVRRTGAHSTPLRLTSFAQGRSGSLRAIRLASLAQRVAPEKEIAPPALREWPAMSERSESNGDPEGTRTLNIQIDSLAL